VVVTGAPRKRVVG